MNANHRKVLFLSLIIFVAAGCSLIPGGGRMGQLTVVDAWSRPAMAGDNGAVYFVIDNATNHDDVLLRAETASAAAAEVHKSEMDANGVMTMRPQPSVEIPAGQQVEFKPGGLHLMLVGLNKDLIPGEQFETVLWFQTAGKVILNVQVREQ